MLDNKVAFIHGRPTPHPIHTKIGKAVNSDFFYVDFKLRWHDRNTNPFKRYLSWFYCAVSFPRKSKYNVFFSEGLHIPPVIMKVLKLIRKDQKIVALLANEVLYFLSSNYYKKSTEQGTLKVLKKYDALICIGEFQYNLAKKLTEGSGVKVYQIQNGVPAEKYSTLIKLKPSLNSKNILFVANGPSGWRTWYKGLDQMIDAFALAYRKDSSLSFTIIGDWDPLESQNLLKRIPQDISKNVTFVGQTDQFYSYLEGSILYLHCARGDSYPTTVLECMAAGLIPIISTITGTQEVVRQVDSSLIVEPDTQAIADKILWFFSLDKVQIQNYSNLSRTIISKYSEGEALMNFEKVFETMLADLK
jgi:glycosyltransferase involved in cell wall biosynthesis